MRTSTAELNLQAVTWDTESKIDTFPYFCAFLLKRYLAGVDEKAFLEGAYSKDSHISAGDEMN